MDRLEAIRREILDRAKKISDAICESSFGTGVTSGVERQHIEITGPGESSSGHDASKGVASDCSREDINRHSLRVLMVDLFYFFVALLFVIWRTISSGDGGSPGASNAQQQSKTEEEDRVLTRELRVGNEPVEMKSVAVTEAKIAKHSGETNTIEDKQTSPEKTRCRSFSDFTDFTEMRESTADLRLFRVVNRASGERHVLKTLPDHSSTAARFEIERDLLLKIAHPCVIRIRHDFVDSGQLCMCIDYAEGGDLDDLRCSVGGTMKPHQAGFFTGEILLALKHIHSLAIIHRDLKPENVFIGGTGHAVLGDFDLARSGIYSFAGEGPVEARAHTMVGTPEFCAPEVLRKQPYGKAVDMWGLGILFYTLCVGEAPYSGMPDEVLRAATQECEAGPSLPEDAPPAANSMLKALLKFDPSQRPSCDALQKVEFFKNMMWEELLNHDLPPPIRVQGPFQR